MSVSAATDLLNATQAAKLLGISRQTLHTAVKAGHFSVAHRDGKGPKFDPAVITREWNTRKDYSRAQSNHVGEVDTGGRPTVVAAEVVPAPFEDAPSVMQAIAKAKMEKMTAEADMARLDLLQRQGELIAVEDVRARGAELGTVLMGAISALPARISQQLAVTTDATEIHQMLEDELNGLIRAIRLSCEVPEDEAI